ncbi:hypothetical protein BDP27DRAFT_1324024 [Rhodocollybia butyracea]|uniref:F-box domain-containing protein n=1 Tax=Rhodocollybia butyracea TaxID=206335 RepID=A0A9P5PVU0_9AGAR|nr:hypothetical protein BDP27DRAFT_1324024 [Rhodocollybia butyracea]
MMEIKGNTSDSDSANEILRTFPPELLARIFSYCPSGTITCPANFTQTSSHWRAVAYSSPSLWTTLTVKLSCKVETDADASRFELAITDQISRSSDLSIALSFFPPSFRNSSTYPSQLQTDLYEKLCRNIVTKFSGKWRFLKIPLFWEAHDFFGSTKELAALEELEINTVPCDIPGCHELFPATPCLRKQTFYLSRRPSMACLERFIPTSIIDLNLVSAPGVLGFASYFIHDFLKLDKFQHLTRLELDRVGWTEPCVLPSESFPRLVVFSLEGSINAMGDLLGSLDLPLLRELSLATSMFQRNGEQGPKVGPALLGLQKMSRFPLVSLSLTWIHQLDDFVQFLSSAATLEELHIRAEGDTDTSRLMKSICYDGHRPEQQILPHLKVFSATSLQDSEGVNCSHFVDFIRSRWWPPTSEPQSSGVDKLQSLDILGCYLNNTTKSELEICRSQGLRC